ncbi:hypothetical protein ILYODFUR_033160 [Ilyodon furcidens]|uniref:Uncharacterized protein n=1 Tax=Ilyodon furcidens TaxID=33524 RepID=A0ABV0UEL7_9TELE
MNEYSKFVQLGTFTNKEPHFSNSVSKKLRLLNTVKFISSFFLPKIQVLLEGWGSKKMSLKYQRIKTYVFMYKNWQTMKKTELHTETNQDGCHLSFCVELSTQSLHHAV